MTKLFSPIFFAVYLVLALTSQVLAANGSFIGVEGERVSGVATVTQDSITLSSDFKSSRGPDLYVYLGNGGPSKIIAKLEKRRGAQSYKIPAGVDVSKFSTVFIHCKKFNHTFGKAKLR